MSVTPSILALAGSLRRDSYNKRLVRIAAEGARKAGAEVTMLDLRDLDLPVFDEDLEAEKGLPSGGRRLKDLLLSNDGMLISSPEYNSSISGALKNAIDWASRPCEGEKPLECFEGKVAALMSASPGHLGGLRGLVTVRSILGNIGVIVLPDQIAVSKAHDAFAEAGSLKDAKKQAAIESLGAGLVAVLKKLRAGD